MKNQKGFTLVEGLLAVLVISFISFASWFVWNNMQKDKLSSNDTSQKPLEGNTSDSEVKTPVEKEKTLSEKEEWTSYTSNGKEYTVSLANGLQFVSYAGNSSILSRTDVAAGSFNKATVTNAEGGNDNPLGLFISYADTDNQTNRGTKTTFTTYGGLSVDKYTFVQTEDPQLVDISKGTTEYSYVVHGSSGHVVHVKYAVTDDRSPAIVEEMVKTVKFN